MSYEDLWAAAHCGELSDICCLANPKVYNLARYMFLHLTETQIRSVIKTACGCAVAAPQQQVTATPTSWTPQTAEGAPPPVEQPPPLACPTSPELPPPGYVDTSTPLDRPWMEGTNG